MEADIQLTRDGQWVCVHDETLDRETTGIGAVRDHLADDLRGLTMRSPTSRATDAPLMFLDDLIEAAGRWSLSSAEIQLDLKVGAADLTDDVLDRFAKQVGPVATRFSLSGSDPAALVRLRSAVPSLPATLSPSGRLGGARDSAVFESRMLSVLEELDGVSMIWVNHRVLQAAYRTRFDLVGFARRYGVGVDTGTIDVGNTGWRAALVLALQAKVDRITSNTPCAVAEQIRRWVGEARPTAAAS